MQLDNRTSQNNFERSQYFQEQYENNRLIRDLIVGLRALRGFPVGQTPNASDSIYLPRFPKEPEDYYKNRKSMSFLTNYFKRAIESDTGKILANNVMVSIDGESNANIPAPMSTYIENVDFDNTSLSMYAREQAKIASEKGGVITIVDYHKNTARPFLRTVDFDDIISFDADPITGVLSRLKFAIEAVESSEDDGYMTVPATYELTPTSWVIRNADNEEISSGEIIRYRDGKKRITDELPISVFYTNRKGLLLAESPYQTLAELTIEYFQVYSDIKNTMFYALKPLLLAKNVPNDFTLQILASFALIKIPEGSEGAELEWVKVDTGAIEQGLEQLKEIQSRIATFSIDANALRPGTLTATQTSIESAGTNAALRAFAGGLQEHIESIVRIMYTYTLEKEHDISVLVDPEFNSMENDKEMRVVLEMQGKQIISKETAREAAVQRKILSADFNEAQEKERLQEDIKLEIEFQDALASMKKTAAVEQQKSDGLLAGSGEEEITEKPRDA